MFVQTHVETKRFLIYWDLKYILENIFKAYLICIYMRG